MATLPVYPYGETANQILNTARIRVNDVLLTAQGYPGGADPGQQFTEIGGGTQAVELNPDGSLILRTQIIFNAAYRKFQKYLANLGYRLLIGDNLQITALPVNSNPDPSVQSWLSWNGFFNGTVFTTTPALPEDFYAPLKIRERLSGTNSIFIPMRCSLDGLRNNYIRVTLNRQWEWRTNGLYLPGATQLTDLQLRYTRYLPALPDPNYYVADTPWYEQTLPIPGCSSAMAWYVAYEVVSSRGGDLADVATLALQNAEGEADKVFNDQARADQRTNCRRQPRGGSSRGRGSGYGLM
jgi:hypothetical protein